jgi:hypothetical protein
MRATDAARLICDMLNVWHQDDRREVLVILTQLVEAERERCRIEHEDKTHEIGGEGG